MAKNGLIAGKFYPPHNGHLYLIRTMIENCDSGYIVICSRKVPNEYENPSAELRKKWLSELFPQIIIYIIEDYGYNPDSSTTWGALIKNKFNIEPTHIYTSETYGKYFARTFNAQYIDVDLDRKNYPISGTMVRTDTYNDHVWNMIPEVVRPYYAIRIVVLGPESCGKTTLCHYLSSYYNTLMVPEYGHQMSEDKCIDNITINQVVWKKDDFKIIFDKQQKMEDSLAKKCNKVLICDTDVFASYVWYRRYVDYNGDSELYNLMNNNNHIPSFYLLTVPNVEFVQDGYRDGMELFNEEITWREHMFTMFKDFLDKENKSYKIIDKASWEDRNKQATTFIDEHINICKNKK